MTNGAMKAARRLEPAAPCHDDNCPSRARHRVEWEESTARLIDNETAAPEMLELLTEAQRRVVCECLQYEGDNPDCLHHRIATVLRLTDTDSPNTPAGSA